MKEPPLGTSRARKHELTRAAVRSFVLLWIIAASGYPGWNSFDATSTGYEFGRNHICDLLSGTTPDGRSNFAASASMNAGVVILVGCGLLPLWWNVGIGAPWRGLCRWLGLLAATLVLAICVEQAFGLSLSHNVITLSAGAAGLLPTAVVAVLDWRSPSMTWTRRVMLLGTMGAAIVNLVSYSMVQLGEPLAIVVPASQKVALLCLLGWLALGPRIDGQDDESRPML